MFHTAGRDVTKGKVEVEILGKHWNDDGGVLSDLNVFPSPPPNSVGEGSILAISGHLLGSIIGENRRWISDV